MQSKSPNSAAGKTPGFFARHNVIVYLAFVLTVILFSLILGVHSLEEITLRNVCCFVMTHVKR